MKKISINTCILIASTMFLTTTVTMSVYGDANGKTRRTLKTRTTGCGSCHGSSASPGVVVSINGPSAVAAGQTAAYTVDVTDVSGTKGGVDIAVYYGTLSPVSSFLKLSNEELTHKNPVDVPSTYEFEYTAPATLGTDTLYAVAKGSDFNDWNWAANKIIDIGSVNDVEESPGLADHFRLDQNYPNPFNPSTVIRYAIPTGGHVSLKVFDLTGREVATLADEHKNAGAYEFQFDATTSFGSPLASGIYLYVVKAGQFSETKKMLLVR